MPFVSHVLTTSSDVAALFTLASLIGLIALVLFWLGSLVLRRVETSKHEDYALETEKYALTLAIFILALTVADVRTTLGKASDAAVAEAHQLLSLDATLSLLPKEVGAPLHSLATNYVAAIITDEWPRLGQINPSLSPDASRFKNDLWKRLAELANNPDHSRTVSLAQQTLQELDLKRVARYELATASIPRIYWIAMLGSLVIAAAMTGRNGFSAKRGAFVFIRYFIFGMIVALAVTMDQPYRGEAHVTPARLQDVLATLSARGG